MRSYKGILLVLLGAVAVAGVSAMTALRVQTQNETAEDKRQKLINEFSSQFPIVDYDAPQPADPEKQAKRRAKGSRFNNRRMVGKPEGKKAGGARFYTDWEFKLPALPVTQSDVVVVGEIVEAHAYLSNDKTGVYSEFSLRVEEVLKGSDQSQLTAGGLITAEREGGRVRFAPDEVALYNIDGQGMPRPSQRYVLFLKNNGEEQDYSILTGYELKAGRVFPLDFADSDRSKFHAYRGVDETAFLRTLRNLITQPSQYLR